MSDQFLRPLAACLVFWVVLHAAESPVVPHAPETVLDIAHEQERWVASLGNLHAVYHVTERAYSSRLAELKPPIDLYWSSAWDIWLDRDLAHYRSQVTLDVDGFAKAVHVIASTRVPDLTPKAFSAFAANSILVGSRSGTSYLSTDTGRLAVRRAEAQTSSPPLETGLGILPILRSLVVHGWRPDGAEETSEFVNPYLPTVDLSGLELGPVSVTTPVVGQREITASFTFKALAASDPGRKAMFIIRMNQMGDKPGPQFWFLTSCESHIGTAVAKTEVSWRVVPKAPWVAIPELRRVTVDGVLQCEDRLTTMEIPTDVPVSTWSIDPSLATTIFDETANKPIYPAQ